MTGAKGGANLGAVTRRIAPMKPFLLTAFLALAACTNPSLTADMAIGTNGVSVNPTLSGNIGGATVYIQP